MARNVMAEGPHPVDRHVGHRLSEIRLRQGYSQTDLARALGLTFQQVQKYEKGANRISASKLWDAAQFLKVDVSALYEGLEADGEALETPPILGSGPTRTSVEIGRMAPRLPVRSQKIVVDLMREMAGLDPDPD